MCTRSAPDYVFLKSSKTPIRLIASSTGIAGADGKPRQLHVEQSLKSIDFADVEPPLLTRNATSHDSIKVRPLVDDPLFKVEALTTVSSATVARISWTEASDFRRGRRHGFS